MFNPQHLNFKQLFTTLLFIAMASSGSGTGYEIVPHISCRFSRKMWVYSYQNHQLKSTANIYLRSDGMVDFQSFGKRSGWHGEWEHFPDEGMICIAFDCRGNEKKLKSLIVLKCGDRPDGLPEMWAGRDSRQRFIVMKLLDCYEECTVHNCWHIV